MSLVFNCHLQPQGPSSLAAVRFNSPIRVSRIRIFPNGVSLFAHAPHIRSLTHPEAFYLDLYFNALPLHPPDKQRASNALVPTSISYPGGLMDFAVDMGSHYATRLMIIKGSFDHLSLAIYGEIVTDSPPVQAYQPKSIVPPEPESLSNDLDPSQSLDPTALAKSLLALIPNAPSLPSAIRLMFCLKPTDEDWDNPDFPHIYANLDNDSEDYDLDTIVSNLDRPIPDDVSVDSLNRFVERLNDFVGPASVDQAYQISNALNLSASQTPLFSHALLNALDLPAIFNATTLADSPTLSCLTNAASNALIARHLHNNTNLLETIREASTNPTTEKPLVTALEYLKSRILGWKAFEDALSNPQGDFDSAANLVYEIGKDEQSLGIWLTSMIMHQDITAKLQENPVSPNPAPPPVLFFRDTNVPVSHDAFIAFVRACLGVASVIGVLAWADSVGNDDCRERTLAVIHLWQSVEGYREIVNHLFLLRQLTRRLKWITTDNDPPRHSGLLAEKVLLQLTSNPQTILIEDMIETILALEQPLAYISESERLALRKLALVADDGLPAAVEELNYDSDRPFSVRRLRTIRVSIAVIGRELDGDREDVDWTLLEAFWSEKSYAFVSRLVDLFNDLSSDLSHHFAVQRDAAQPNQQLIEQLFSTIWELLVLIERLVKLFPLSARALRRLVGAVVDVVTCVDGAAEVFACLYRMNRKGVGVGGGVGGVAERVRVVCLRVLRSFVGRDVVVEPGRVGAEVVLRTLLVCGQVCGGGGGGGVEVREVEKWKGIGGERDLVAKVGQVFKIIGHILPANGSDDAPMEEDEKDQEEQTRRQEKEKEREHWVMNVLPNVLLELRMFMRVLTVEDQVYLVKRLVRLDAGVIGVGEWLVLEEVKEVRDVLRGLVYSETGEVDLGLEEVNENEGGDGKEQEQREREREKEVHRAERNVQLYRVYMGLRFFWLLATPDGPAINQAASEWFFNAISGTPELSSLLGQILLLLFEGHYTSPPLAALTRLFAQRKHLDKLTDEARCAVLLGLIRLAQADVTSALAGDYILDVLGSVGGSGMTMAMVDALRLEVGRLCAVCAEHVGGMSVQVGEMVLGVLEWLCQSREGEEGGDWRMKLRVLRGVTVEALGVLCDALAGMFPEKEGVVELVKTSLTVDEDEDFVPIPVELPESLVLSLSSVESLLHKSRHTRDRSGDVAGIASHRDGSRRPTTPKGTKTPDILGTIISPPTALLRSPAATGLTKTYVNNDFRSLRQVPSARLNTSRLPSMHVDDFENGTTGTVAPGTSVSPVVVPVPIPMADVSAFGGLLNMG